MRTVTKALLAIGMALAAAAGLWALIAPGQLVKYPSDVDKTAVATGRFTLFFDPATGAPRAHPQVLPLTIHRRLHVLSSTGSQAIVREDDVEQIAGLPSQDFQQQYVIDRSSIKNQASSKAFAYAPAHVVDRAPAYSINLPFDTGSGPYEIWKNEVGRSYAFRRQGRSVTRNGVELIPLQGRLTNAPAQPYYLEQLRALGLPSQTTFRGLTPQLRALGLDPAQLATVLLPLLSPADRGAIQAALAGPIGLRYVVSVRTRLLVEPTSGAIVSLQDINQTLGVQPDLGGLRQIAAILGKPQYRSSPVVQVANATLARLAAAPPTAPVFNLAYGQTPASVADIAAYARGKADSIDTVETTIPLVLLIVGVLAAAVGLAIWLYDRRGRHEGAPGGLPPAQPAGGSSAPHASPR